MVLQVPGCLLVFFLLLVGLGWPAAVRLVADPAERLLVAAVLSLLGIFVFSWGVYVCALPWTSCWLLPVLALAGLVAGRRSLVDAGRDRAVRQLLLLQAIVAVWCLGWLAFVVSYSGGGWTSDWFEHWERAQFFLDRAPLDFKFLGFVSLTARPPLANVVTATLLALGGVDFAHYQFASTVLASLVFLPAALLVRRFGGGTAALAMLAVLLMLNPLVVQNATFAWTKLPSAFFVLAGWLFFLRAHDPEGERAMAPLCGAALAAGLLAHYSAGPYVVILAVAWLWRGHGRAAWRAALAGGGVLLLWFGWAVAVYGLRGTLLSNSSVTDADPHVGGQFVKIALNLRDTLVPHFLRPLDPALIAQTSPWGYWRDWFFQTYQLNLFFAFGSVGWLAILWAVRRDWPATPPRLRAFWAGLVVALVGLGVAVHGARDTWGLTHICLQPLVILGLAYLASRWHTLGRAWCGALIAGAMLDCVLGIVLHFAVQNFAFDRWRTPPRPASDWLAGYSDGATMNAAAKVRHGLVFFGDALALPSAVLLALLAALLVFALRRTHPTAS